MNIIQTSNHRVLERSAAESAACKPDLAKGRKAHQKHYFEDWKRSVNISLRSGSIIHVDNRLISNMFCKSIILLLVYVWHPVAGIFTLCGLSSIQAPHSSHSNIPNTISQWSHRNSTNRSLAAILLRFLNDTPTVDHDTCESHMRKWTETCSASRNKILK